MAAPREFCLGPTAMVFDLVVLPINHNPRKPDCVNGEANCFAEGRRRRILIQKEASRAHSKRLWRS
jgi:hypothetical protein